MKLLFKILTFPFWFPMWLYTTSIKLAIGATLIALGAGGVYYYFNIA